MPFPTTHPALAKALDAQGYREPTPVQEAVLSAEAGRDLLVSAQTGSGKTVAFGLAAAPTLLGEADGFERAGAPLALVIAPTRELAMQVSRELAWLYAPAGARIATCVGGMDARAEQRVLSAGCHIVVGTPGRLRDHLERGNLDFSALRVVVLDEADEMLDMGFREDLEEILDSTPKERRTFLFSATIAKEIASLAKRYQRDAVRIDTIRRDEAHGDIEYRAVRVAPNEVENAVVNLLRYFESPGALIFCATRERVRHLYGALRERGFQVVQLSGELSQKERSDALQALRDGHARACIATDVAARGLDLPELGLVIHADMPTNTAGLLHRSGRTGRAGRKGVSVVIVPHTKRRVAERLLTLAKLNVEWSGAPLAEEIRAKDQARLLDDPLLNEPASPEDLELAQRILADRTPEAVAAALIRLHRARLPAPEEMFGDVPDYRSPEPRAPRLDRQDRGDRPERSERPERAPRQDYSGSPDSAWFRLPVGRSKNADPKWLVPLICRLGHVTKKDIGAIKIFDNETKFEISREVEPRFLEAIKAASDAGEIRINPASAPGAAPPSRADRGLGPRPTGARTDRPNPSRPRPAGPRPTGPRPTGPRPDRPRYDGPKPGGPPRGAPPPKKGKRKPN